MFALRHMPIETEFVKRAILIVLAVLAALLLVTRMAGADGVPGRLPDDMNKWAKPLPEAADMPFFPEVGPPLRTNEPNQVLWRIMKLHRSGYVEEALAAWERVDLLPDAEVWRQVAMAAANLQAARVEQAETRLDAALEIDPHNAVAHYYLGLLRRAQARNAKTWPETVFPPPMLVALPQIAPNTKEMYELAALDALTTAIKFAPQIDLDAPLAPYPHATPECRYLPLVTPTVRDLLETLAVDRVAARAHNVLGEMSTEQGKFAEAEEHLDAAAAEQLNAPLAYRRLAERLQEVGRHDDAARVFLKALRTGDANLIPAIRTIVNGFRANVD